MFDSALRQKIVLFTLSLFIPPLPTIAWIGFDRQVYHKVIRDVKKGKKSFSLSLPSFHWLEA
jgi:hypothetical protein